MQSKVQEHPLSVPKSSAAKIFRVVEVTGLEPATAWSQTRNATNCATPRFRFAGAKVRNKNEK